MLTWHLDDGVLCHTCHGDGILDDTLGLNGSLMFGCLNPYFLWHDNTWTFFTPLVVDDVVDTLA